MCSALSALTALKGESAVPTLLLDASVSVRLEWCHPGPAQPTVIPPWATAEASEQVPIASPFSDGLCMAARLII